VNGEKMCGALAVIFFILTMKQHNFSKYDTCETQILNLSAAKSLAGGETPH
jgi:hypothetical protein